MTDNSSPNAKPLSQLTRDELYTRIRASSKDAVVLEEMQRLGFWPANTGMPDLTAELIEQESQLIQSLHALSSDLQKFKDPERARAEMRKARMEKARARREETRQKNAAERHAKALSWHQRRAESLLYLGEDLSHGLQNTDDHAEKLALHGLPAPQNVLALANMMGLSLHELRFLAYHRRVSKVSHYQRFTIPKKSGGLRHISAPMPRLKRAQYWILDNILSKVGIHPAAHGFVPGRSIVTNATPHVGQAVVINLDLKDFFHSILYPRIKGVFRALGYSEALSSLLGLLCTELPVEEVGIDQERFFVAKGQRHLPQGAPTSPMLTNILCQRLDKRLAGLAQKFGFAYTRYADDLTFSAPKGGEKKTGALLWQAKRIIESEGLTPHPEKEHVMRPHKRQEVTGVVVNRKLSVDRQTLRRFRATLYQLEKEGCHGKHWNGNPNVLSALEGYAYFIHMLDPVRARPYLDRLDHLRERMGATPTDARAARVSHEAFRRAASEGKAPWENWWTPTTPSEPTLEKTALQTASEKKAARTASASATETPHAPAHNAPDEAPTPPEAMENEPKPPTGFSNFHAGLQILTALLIVLVLGFPTITYISGAIALAIQRLQNRMNWSLFLALIFLSRALTRLLY